MINIFSLKKLFLFALTAGFLLSFRGQAQIGPTPDPAFAPTSLRAPATVHQALEQADGKRLLVGDFSVIDGQATNGLARLLPGGNVLDADFQRNTRALSGYVNSVLLLPNGQILLSSYSGDSLRLGSVRRRTLLRLNADGTPDASFNAGAGLPVNSRIDAMVAQPDGKLLLAGRFTSFGGQPVGRLVRLLPNGSVDMPFVAAGSGLGPGLHTLSLALQANGSILVGGNFGQIHGRNAAALGRLLPSGAFDTSFDALGQSGARVESLALRADGLIMVRMTSGALDGNYQPVQRLLGNGQQDTSFRLDTALGLPTDLNNNSLGQVRMVVQPDNRILLAARNAISYNGQQVGHLIRLQANGSMDNAFATPLPRGIAQRSMTSLQLLPTGKVLVAGRPAHYGANGRLPFPVALLNTDGSTDPSLDLHLQDTYSASVQAVAQLPNGQLLVGGVFDEFNGQPARNLVRLNQDGTVDASFAPQLDDQVNSIALQGGSNVLLGGSFGFWGNVSRPGLARLLPSGSLDASFSPAIQSTARGGPMSVARMLLTPGNKVLVTGGLATAQNDNPVLVQLNGSTGQLDATFLLPSPGWGGAIDFAVQSTGKVVIAGYYFTGSQPAQTYRVFRFLPNGQLDPGFMLTHDPGYQFVNTLVVDAADRLYLGGSFEGFGSITNSVGVVRMLADGQLDASYRSGLLAGQYVEVRALALQPNGRLLAGGWMPVSATANLEGSARLLSNGSVDASYISPRGPEAKVHTILVQPSGTLVMGGLFQQANSQNYNGLVRLLDANVLALKASHHKSALAAWPVPAHGELNLMLDEAYPATQVRLLDTLGRVVFTQTSPGTRLTLRTGHLTRGLYFVQVEYPGGTVSQRVTLE